MVFPVVMYECESWTIKKAEPWRIYAFELWCWRRLLRVPWTPRRSNQSYLKEISPGFFGGTDAEAETPTLWPPDAKNWLISKDPDAGKDWRQEVKEMTEDELVGWHHRLDGHAFEQAPGVGDGQAAKSQTWLSNWTELNKWRTKFSIAFNFHEVKSPHISSGCRTGQCRLRPSKDHLWLPRSIVRWTWLS